MSTNPAPWFVRLVESVDALGEAAREWQLAHRAAAVVLARADPTRCYLSDGKVTGRPDPEAAGWKGRRFIRSPHERAVYALQDLYREAAQRTRGEYEHAALLFASGAAWAVRAVRDGGHPVRVVLAADRDKGRSRSHREFLPGDLDAALDAFEADGYYKAHRLRAAHSHLMDGLAARRTAEEIDGQEYVSEPDATTLFECWAVADGIADAADTYGRLLKEALGDVLAGPRAEHHRQLAAARDAGNGVAQ